MCKERRQFSVFIFWQLGKYQKAFEHLGNALTFDPNNYKVCGYLHKQAVVWSFFFFYQVTWMQLIELLAKQFGKISGHSLSVGTSRLSSYGVSNGTCSSNVTLMIAFIPRPSWLQAAWCRPMVTLMWPWTSTEWLPVPSRRAPPSGTTSACASLARRNL